MTPEERLAQGSRDMLAAFNARPALSSLSLSYNPATMKMNANAKAASASAAGILDGSNSFQGYASEKLASKLAEYAKNHKGDGGLAALLKQQSSQAAVQGTSKAVAGSGSMLATSGTIGGTMLAAGTAAVAVSNDPAFSYSELLSNRYGFQVVYCLLWIVLGVFLLFFGLPSFYWITTPRFKPKAGKTSRRIIGGGIGGLVIGFLSGSFLSGGIITNAVSTRQTSSLSPGGMFAVWLAPGLLLCAISAHVALISRLLLGLLAGVCMTLILTALFGIHTILVRSVLLAIFCVALTTPLLVPPKSRYARTKRFLLNLDTSIVGAVTFLDGVALFAPPKESSRAWIDLWTLLFAPDNSPSQKLTIQHWGSAAFKGYIAGAVLSVAISVAFEAWFHRSAGESAEDEWNEYLGVYTGRMEKGAGAAGGDVDVPSATEGGDLRIGFSSRAGMFQESEPLWKRILNRLDDRSPRNPPPAQYGNIAGGASAPSPGGFSFTQRKPSSSTRPKRAVSMASTASTTTPARFQAVTASSSRKGTTKLHGLAERGEYDDEDDDDDDSYAKGDGTLDDDDDDSDATDVEDNQKTIRASKSLFQKSKDNATKEALDTVSALPKLINYGGYALPPPQVLFSSSIAPSSRPPSFRTDSASSASGGVSGSASVGSQLSGSTAVTTGSTSSSPTSTVEKPFTSYRDSGDSPSQRTGTSTSAATAPRLSAPPASNGAPHFSAPATPSLINAIDRIQRAQQQARQWAAQGSGDGKEPYGPQKITSDKGDVD